MFDNLTWNTETILILGIVTFVAFALLGLVVWNSKTNRQVKTLISIDDSLKHLDAVEVPGQHEPPETTVPEEIQANPTQEAPLPETPLEPEPEAVEAQPVTNIGRSGKIYTKEELEAQIR